MSASFPRTSAQHPPLPRCPSNFRTRVRTTPPTHLYSAKGCRSGSVSVFSSHRNLRPLSLTQCGVICFVHNGSEPSGLGEFLEEPAAQESIKEAGERSNASDWTVWFRKVACRIFGVNSEKWTVPWSAKTIVQVMFLWITTFWFVGTWIAPYIAQAAGFSKDSLTHRGQALYSLLTDIAEGFAGMAILHLCLAKFRPLPPDWFKLSLRGSWYVDVVVGCSLFPLVNLLSHINIRLVLGPQALPVGVSSVEQSIVARDPVAMVLYAVVVSICAPIWEEIVFRGFLLPSLTRYMPLWSSILVSAVAFALAHFNVQRILPLVFLGVVMGVVFARSRNLLSSMVLHSLWNGFVFLDLMK